MPATDLDRFQQYLNHAQDCILLTDAAGVIVAASRSTTRLFQTDFVGQTFLDQVAEGKSKAAFSAWLADHEATALLSNATVAPELTDLRLELQGDQHWRPMQGSAFCCVMDDQVRCVITLRDIKSQLERESSLIREATTDQLTGLLNRRGFQSELERHLGNPLAIAILDVDDFKQVNDRRGHPVGDQTLCAVAAVLNRAFPTSMVARLGGDEFGIMMAIDPQLVGDPDVITQRFAQAVQTIGNLDSPALQCTTVSCGVTIDIAGSASARQLLTEADRLLYRSKAAGKNQITHSELASS